MPRRKISADAGSIAGTVNPSGVIGGTPEPASPKPGFWIHHRRFVVLRGMSWAEGSIPVSGPWCVYSFDF